MINENEMTQLIRNDYENPSHSVEPIQCGFIKFNYGTYYSSGKEGVLAGKITVPLKQPVNSHVDNANKTNIEWLIAKGLAREEDIPKLEGANFAALFPTALRKNSLSDLVLETQFISFLFILDDVIDKQLPSLKLNRDELDKELTAVFKTFENILQGVYQGIKAIPTNSKLPKYKEFCSALFDIRSGMNKLNHFITPYDFYYHLKNYFSGLRTEVKNRASQKPLTLTAYRDIRITTGAVPLTFAFIAYIKGLDLRKEMEDDSDKRRIAEAAAITLSYDNDFCSFEKEKLEPEHTNLIHVFLDKFANYPEKDKPVYRLQAAFDEAIRLRNDEMYGFLSGIRDLQATATEKDKNFLEYIEILKDCILDNNNWSAQRTTRYKTKASGFRYDYEEGMLPERVKSKDCEEAVLITSSISSKDIGIRLIQEIEEYDRRDKLKTLKESGACLQRIAALVKAGVFGYEDLRYLVAEIQAKTSIKGREIAIEFAKVLDPKALIDLSSQIFPIELLHAVSKSQSLSASKDFNMSHQIIELIRDLFRADTFGQSLIYASYKHTENTKFTNNFFGQLARPMILPIMEDLAVLLSKENEKAHDKRVQRRPSSDKLKTCRFLPLDYSENTKKTLRTITNQFYFEGLKNFGENLSDIPEAIPAGASSIYKSLQNISDAISNLFNTEEVITVKFSKEELSHKKMQSTLPRMDESTDEVKIGVRKFLVYVVGLYLNLRLLGFAYWEFTSSILNLPDDEFFEQLENANTNHNEVLNTELTSLSKIKSNSKDFEALQKRLSKFVSAADLKEELKKNIKTIKKDFLAVFNSKNPHLFADYPALSGYLSLLINRKDLMGEHKESVRHEILALQHVLDDGIVEWCLNGIRSLLKINVSSENESDKNSDIGQDNSPFVNKALLREELRADINVYGDFIITLYAKLSIFNNMPVYEEATANSLIKIYTNKKDLFNLFQSPVIESRNPIVLEHIVDEALNEPLKIIFEDKITSLSKQLTDINPTKFSTELQSMVSYAYFVGAFPEVSNKMKEVFNKLLDWLEKEFNRTNENQLPVCYEILVCLSFYAAVFDVDKCLILDRISSIKYKINQDENKLKEYKSVLSRFDKTPKELASAFYLQQFELLTQQLNEAIKIRNSNPFGWYKSKEVIYLAEKTINEITEKMKQNTQLQVKKSDLLEGVKNQTVNYDDSYGSYSGFYSRSNSSKSLIDHRGNDNTYTSK